MEFVELTKEEFSSFNQTVTQGSFLQTPEMARLLLDSAWEVFFVAVKAENTILEAALLCAKSMTGGKHFELQYGPIYETHNSEADRLFYTALKDYVAAHGALELIVIPNVDYQRFDDAGQPLTEPNDAFIAQLNHLGYSHTGLETGYNKRGEATWHYVKDLSLLSNDKRLLQSYTKAGQYSVKQTQKFGIQVAPLTYEELSDFKAMTALTSGRKGYHDHDLSYYQRLYRAFGAKGEFLGAKMNFAAYAENLQTQMDKNQTVIEKLDAEIAESDSAKKKTQKKELVNQVTSYKKRLTEVAEVVKKYGNKDVLLAGALFIYGASETIYLFSGSYEEFKSFYAPFAIQHAVMKKCLEKGISSYNFFGIQGVFDGSDGVLRFKENFGGYVVRKSGYFWYYPHPLKHKMLTGVKKALGRQ